MKSMKYILALALTVFQLCFFSVAAHAGQDTVKINYPVQFHASAPGATSWFWDFGDGEKSSDSENPVHIYKAPGTYQVTLTSGNGNCTSVFVRQVEAVAVPKIESGFAAQGASEEDLSFSLFPNPAMNEVNVSFPAAFQKNWALRLVDAHGRVWMTRQQNAQDSEGFQTLDLSSLAPGVYFIEMLCEGKKLAQRFIKI